MSDSITRSKKEIDVQRQKLKKEKLLKKLSILLKAAKNKLLYMFETVVDIRINLDRFIKRTQEFAAFFKVNMEEQKFKLY